MRQQLDDQGECYDKQITDADIAAMKDARMWDNIFVAEQPRIERLKQIFKANGRIPGGKLSFLDLLVKDKEYCKKRYPELMMRDSFSSDSPLLVPRVLSEIAREGQEPVHNLYASGIFKRLDVAFGSQTVWPAYGGLMASDIAEGMEYPEQTIEQAGTIASLQGKSGIKFKMTHELIQMAQFDIIGRMLRLAGAAMGRHRERKLWDKINGDSSTLFDNTSSAARTTTGRDGSANLNGTITLEDLYFMYNELVNRGYLPNTVLMHPSCYEILLQESFTKNYALINGLNNQLWRDPSGKGRPNAWPGAAEAAARLGDEPHNQTNAAGNLPFFPSPMRVIVSPYVTRDVVGNDVTCTVVMLDSRESGIIAEAGPMEMDSWSDPSVDVEYWKLRHFYDLASINNGEGMVKALGVRIARSYDIGNRTYVTLTSSDITRSLSGDMAFSGTPTNWTGSV